MKSSEIKLECTLWSGDSDSTLLNPDLKGSCWINNFHVVETNEHFQFGQIPCSRNGDVSSTILSWGWEMKHQ